MSLPGGMSCKDWENGNYLIPVNREILEEEFRKLLAWCYHGDLYRPENKAKLLKLRANIAALKAYRQVFLDAEAEEKAKNNTK